MIETRAYGRAGLLGNPSDGYFGKTIAFSLRNFRARVLLYPSARVEIRPSKADFPIWESLDDMRETTRWRGYYGGIRIIQALLMRFSDYCAEQGIEISDRNFTIEYESNIPQRLGLGGSSAIISATLRALMEHFEIDIPRPVQANLVLETETRELGVTSAASGSGASGRLSDTSRPWLATAPPRHSARSRSKSTRSWAACWSISSRRSFASRTR